MKIDRPHTFHLQFPPEHAHKQQDLPRLSCRRMPSSHPTSYPNSPRHHLPKQKDVPTTHFSRSCVSDHLDLESQEIYVNNYKNSLSKEVKNLNPEIKRILVVLTDGKDNYSKHKENDLNIRLKRLREDGLLAIFLAANQDAVTTGNIYGFSSDTSLTIGSDYLTSSRGMGYVNKLCRSVSSGESSVSLAFTQVERDTSVSTPFPISEEDILPPPPPLPAMFQRSIRPNSPIESPPGSPPTPVSSHVSPNNGICIPTYNFEEQAVIETLLSLKKSNK